MVYLPMGPRNDEFQRTVIRVDGLEARAWLEGSLDSDFPCKVAL